MDRPIVMDGTHRASWPVPVLAWLFWVPAFCSAAYEWTHGSYYGYGWVVPPIGLWLILRRWREGLWDLRRPTTTVLWWMAAAMLPWFTLLRVLNHADPAWRMPIGLAGVTAALAAHGLLVWCVGRAGSAGFWRITLFLATAVPLPSVVEVRVVHWLTGAVLAVVSRLFDLAGEPLVVAGELMMRQGMVVEVSEGCSGIRSFHWFVMGAWLFAELHRMAWRQALALLAWALGMAFAINVARAWTLAQVRFTFGQEAFETAHDWVGLVAFVVSAALFHGFSCLLSGRSNKRVVSIKQ